MEGGQRKGPEPGGGKELGDFSTRPPGLEQRNGARRSYKPGQTDFGKDLGIIFWEIWEAPGGSWVGSHVL